MKLPSLFKTARHQRFYIKPRYYDPVKEEIEARTDQIRYEMKRDAAITEGLPKDRYYPSRIQGAFRQGRGGKAVSMSGPGFTQLVIVLLLLGAVTGYMFYGNVAVYVVLLLSSVLLYLKFKRIL